MAKKTENEVLIIIPKINLQKISVNIEGITSLITHRWSEKAKKLMLDNMTGNKTKARELRNPIMDFITSAYWLTEQPAEYTEEAFQKAIDSGARFGFPSTAFKKSAATAAFRSKITKDVVSTLATFFIEDEFVEIVGTPIMREDMVTVGMGGADLRYRAEFPEWKATLNITYNADIITSTQLVNLFNLAGFATGIGEWRVEKKGQYGMFRVV